VRGFAVRFRHSLARRFADMGTMREIQIIDLLCRREAELVKVAQAEEAVRNLLGGAAFPFPAPPDLPSRRKVTKAKKRLAVKADAETFPGLRKLEPPEENAYRLVYRFNGEEKESFQNDFEFLLDLLKFPAEAFELLSIETVLFRQADDWQARQMLWQVT
jgi:hypothetical protein